LFRKNLPGHWQSIETGGTGRGVPDSNYCINGKEGWVEFKCCDAQKVVIRPEQVAWIHRRVREGGRVWIATRRQHSGGPRKGDPCDELFLTPGSDILALCEDGLFGATYHSFANGPARWDWEAVGRILVADEVRQVSAPLGRGVIYPPVAS
jgi:hypothetical protein